MLTRLQSLAERNGLSLAALIREIIRQWFEAQERKA
jgi:predicted DNA-binding protein